MCSWFSFCLLLPLQHEADGALRKARLLQSQRQEEYEKAKVSTSRLEEEQNVVGGGAATAKQLEKRRRLEEETLQKVKNHLFDDFSLVYLTFIAHSSHSLHQQLQCCINLLSLIWRHLILIILIQHWAIWQVDNNLLDEQPDRPNLIILL